MQIGYFYVLTRAFLFFKFTMHTFFMLPENDLLNILHHVPGLYLILNPELYIMDASNAYLNATLTKREDVIGRYIFDVFPDNPNEANATGEFNLKASLKRVLKFKKQDTMPVQKYDIRNADGKFLERYWDPANIPVFNAKGEVQLIIHTAKDVTDIVKSQLRQKQFSHILNETAGYTETLKSNEAADIESENIEITLTLLSRARELNETLDCMLEGIQIISKDWKYLYLNKAAANQGKQSKESLIGHTMMEIYPGIEHTELFAAMKKCITENKPDSIINEFVFPDGTKEWYELSLQPVPEGIFILSVNITGRKQAENEITKLNEALEKKVEERTEQLEFVNRELEAFSYSVSHDLRAPLRSINGFTKILAEEYAAHLDSEAKRYLDIIISNSKKMGQLIDDLLAFSRLGKQEVVKIRIKTRNLVENIVSELRENYPNTEVKIRELSEINGDYAMMKQVFVNLISNAFKYSSRIAQPAIEIGSYSQKNELVFYVKDNGAGFDMKYYAKLFGVFQRLHKQKEFDGTGVGLSIVKRIITKHNGDIWAEGKESEGAVFYFSLPLNN